MNDASYRPKPNSLQTRASDPPGRSAGTIARSPHSSQWERIRVRRREGEHEWKPHAMRESGTFGSLYEGELYNECNMFTICLFVTE